MASISSSLPQPEIGVLEVYGHSMMTGYGNSDIRYRTPSRVAAAFGAEEHNYAANGTILAREGMGLQNFYRASRAPRYNQGYAAYASAALVSIGLADMNSYNDANVFKTALRSLILYIQSGGYYDDTHASIAYTGWLVAKALNRNIGTTTRASLTNGDSFVITVPSDFPGGEIDLNWLNFYGTGTMTNVVTGSTSKTVTEIINNATDAPPSHYNRKTTRITGLNPGSHTITCTLSAVSGFGIEFDGWSVRSPAPPVVLLMQQPRLTSSAYTAWLPNLDDTKVATLNTAIQAVAGEFDTTVQYVAAPEVTYTDQAHLTVDSAHPNDQGCKIIADSLIQSIGGLAVTFPSVGHTVTPINVLDYGADPTGLQDSTAAFQLAITAADTSADHYGGHALYIPSGTYKITSTLTVRNNIRIYGDGIGSLLRITNPSDPATAPNFYLFTFSSGYHTSWKGFAVDAAAIQTSDTSGVFDMRGSGPIGVTTFSDIMIGDNVYCGWDLRHSVAVSETYWDNIHFFSITDGTLVGVRGVSYGWRLGGGSEQTNGLYLNNIGCTSANYSMTTANPITWPLSGATVALNETLYQFPSTGGNVWIGAVRCTFTGVSGNSLTGVTGGAASDGTYTANARVVQAGPTWIETNFADTLEMTNFLLQDGDYGIRNSASATSNTTAIKLSNGAFDGIAGPALVLGRNAGLLVSNVQFDGCGRHLRSPQIDCDTVGNPNNVIFDGCLFIRSSASTSVRMRSNASEWQFNNCIWRDYGGSGSAIWAYKQFSTAVSTGGWNNSVTTLPIDQLPPAGIRTGGIIKVDSELIHYTGTQNSPLALTGATRGAFGTTAASHTASATVAFPSTGLLIDPNTNYWSVTGSSFFDNGNTANYGIIVAPGTSQEFLVQGNRFRASLVDDAWLDGGTGIMRNWANNINAKYNDTVGSGSATTTLPVGKSFLTVTGSGTITSITPTYPGHEVTLVFTSTASLTDGSNLKLNGNFTGSADRVIRLICDGTSWFESSRSAN